MGGVTKCMLGIRLILIGMLTASLSAQIQLPGSGGRFPGSGGPGSTSGPFPGSGGGAGGRGRTADPGSTKNRKDTIPVITTTGILRAVAGNQFVIEADDHRIITYKAGLRMTGQKDGKPAELTTFATADHISVDSTEDDQGFFTATAVTFNTPGTSRERADAARTWDLPNLGAGSAKPTADSKRGDDDRPALRRKDADPPQPDAAPAPSANAAEADADDNRPATQIRPNDPAPDADDPGRPQIRRGKPAQRASATNTEPDSITPDPAAPISPSTTAVATRVADASAAGSVTIQEDPIVVKAREAAAEFSGSLPNFFCRQLTTRYESDRPKNGWQALDTISADVAYEDGHESYTNVKVGSKAQKSMEDVGGNWSTGEFASLLDDLFHPATAATFRKTGQDTIAGRGATTFTFEVARERSHWRVSVGGQLYYPAFRGTIWVDRETSRVLRIEMESRNMPLLFPLSKTEEAVDYEFVRLATAQPFLLPANSEVLSCDQGSPHCTRNRIEFRNYRKFGAESGITFEEKK
jgi:hypothetical protein